MKSPKITIGQATLVSLPAVNRLFIHAVNAHFAYFPQAVQQRVIREHALIKLARAALDPRRIILVAKSHGTIIGYCIGAAPKTGPAQIFWLYVDPAYRGANIGLTLLSRMLKILARKGAKIVSIATHDHRRYYERQGFKYHASSVIDSVPMDILIFEIIS